MMDQIKGMMGGMSGGGGGGKKSKKDKPDQAAKTKERKENFSGTLKRERSKLLDRRDQINKEFLENKERNTNQSEY